MKRRIAALAFGFLAASAVPLLVRAGTDNLPGSMCVGTNAPLTVTSNGNADNINAVAVTAVCPAERLMVNGALTTNFSSRVWVNDRHTTQGVCCRVVSRTPNGGTKLGTEVCSSGSTGDEALDLPGVTDNYTFAHFFVRCTMPPSQTGNSRIITYRSTQS
jgi:hypothetical protein